MTIIVSVRKFVVQLEMTKSVSDNGRNIFTIHFSFSHPSGTSLPGAIRHQDR